MNNRNKNKFRIILYSLLDPFKINLVGQLKVNEIFVVLSALSFFKVNDFNKFRLYKRVLQLLALLLTSQIITDLFVVQNNFQDMFRGWAITIVSALSFVFFFKLFSNEKTIIFYIFFSIFRTAISPADDRAFDTEMATFKFWLVPILNNVVLLISYFLYTRKKSYLIYVIFISYGILNISLDSRSNGLIFIVSTIILYIYTVKVKFPKSIYILSSIIFLLVSQLAYVFYINSVLNNEIGGEHSKRQVLQLDNPYNPLELLINGRGETFAALTAIKDKPLFGHGSWAKDTSLKYTAIIAESKNDEVELLKLKMLDNDYLVPSHSILLGAWVNYGIMGFFSSLILFLLLLKVGFNLIRKYQVSELYPIIIVVTLQLIWTFVFSPFQHLRYTVPQLSSILIACYYLYMIKPKSDKVMIIAY